MKAIIKENVRILRPCEYKKLIKKIPSFHHQVCFQTLLFTGMRFAECKRLKENHDWFDGDFIRLPSLKKKAKQKERWIRLNGQGRLIVSQYLNNKDIQLPCQIVWNENLKRWSEKAGIGDEGVSSKTTRKTWESWLSFYFPQNQLHIMQSQGHDLRTSFSHYLNMPFTEQDKSEMKEFVEGWI